MKLGMLCVAVALAGVGCKTSEVVESAPPAQVVSVEMRTSKGTIELELDAEKAPETVRNFVTYANAGFYDRRPMPGSSAMPSSGVLPLDKGLEMRYTDCVFTF